MYYEFVSSSAPEQREGEEEEDGEVFNQDSSSLPLPSPRFSFPYSPPLSSRRRGRETLKVSFNFHPRGRKEGGRGEYNFPPGAWAPFPYTYREARILFFF